MKFKIVLLRKVDSYYILESIKKYKNGNSLKTIKYGDKRYILDKTKPCYITRKYFIFFIEIESGGILQFNTVENVLDPEMVDKIIGKNILFQLFKGISRQKDTTNQIISFIVGILIGGLIGWIICQSIYSNKIQEILTENSDSVIIINFFRGLLKW